MNETWSALKTGRLLEKLSISEEMKEVKRPGPEPCNPFPPLTNDDRVKTPPANNAWTNFGKKKRFSDAPPADKSNSMLEDEEISRPKTTKKNSKKKWQQIKL